MRPWQNDADPLQTRQPERLSPRLAKGLGWSSIGVGLAILGASAVGAMLTRRRRRAGLAPLVIAGLATGTAGVVAGTALEVFGALRQRRDMGVWLGRRTKNAKETAVQIITIARSPEEVYAYWHDPDNLPRFMKHVESVGVIGEGRTHWTVRGPGGILLRWDAETVADRPNETIVWRTLPGADVTSTGSVQFVRAAGGRGTEVWLELRYDSPGGKLGKAIAMLFGKEPGQLAYQTLRALKQMLEVGEMVQSDASIHTGPHPARPTGPLPESVIARKETQR